jgi:hypothetical protein
MESSDYKGFRLWGHAILQQEGEGIVQPERYAASGTITRGGKLVEASGILGLFDLEEEAHHAGLDWARAWVDAHG